MSIKGLVFRKRENYRKNNDKHGILLFLPYLDTKNPIGTNAKQVKQTFKLNPFVDPSPKPLLYTIKHDLRLVFSIYAFIKYLYDTIYVIYYVTIIIKMIYWKKIICTYGVL